ncbi:facilitated trehalose transporter Tret1-like [Neocloeon triangulifer]|uniref:facilitated trehalose transporter Tret1-like n=1 Tax=Neocloeon triangulifer TaxID=2078957 RepID=UPI00286F9815|nr:facilitated trehalose transporter Tret1-like [Neocloeon triangulifer]XP_059484674.1 facilitated trehalose transporter Tret1-like [Neocloeon triangulifer]
MEIRRDDMGMNKHSQRKAILAQAFLTTAVLLVTATNGMTAGFPALLLPQLESENSTLPTTEEEGSWITSIHSIVTPIGSLASGPIMERLGRRTTLLLSIVPGLMGWLTISLSKSHTTILIGRSLTGITTGLSAPPALVLLAEMAEPKLRGFLVGAPSTSFSIGILIIYSLNTILPWQMVAAVATTLPFIAFASFFLLPESPLWLAKMNRPDEAMKSLTWLRGGNAEQARQELELLEEQQQHNKIIEEACSDIKSRSSARPILRALMVANVFNFFQVMAGTFTIIFYAVSVLQQATGGQVSDTDVAVITALTRVILTTMACFMLLRIGRRPMTISSGVGSGIAAFVLSAWLYWVPESDDHAWVPAALIIVFVIFNSYGFFMIQGLMIGEMFPARARGPASGITCAIINVTLFATSKTYPWMTHVLKPTGLFLFFGLMTAAGTLFAYLFIPETQGSTLAEIEEHFSGPSLIWRSKSIRKNADGVNDQDAEVAILRV